MSIDMGKYSRRDEVVISGVRLGYTLQWISNVQ